MCNAVGFPRAFLKWGQASLNFGVAIRDKKFTSGKSRSHAETTNLVPEMKGRQDANAPAINF